MRRLPSRRVRAEIDALIAPARDAVAAPAPGRIAFVRAPGRAPPGHRVYAIGDVHGCADQLGRLHQAIAEDLARWPSPRATLVHLGDYIDWGKDSAGVLARLARGAPAPHLAVINLMGDHERMLLDALDGDRAAATDWLLAGGGDTLRNWGADAALPRERWEAAIPRAQLGVLRSLALSHRAGSYLFVHAGVRPNVALEEQAEDDLLRIRHPFLYTEQELGAVVVHGHSSAPLPVIQPNRIGLDTGAGNGGALTCAVLEDDALGFLVA